ncbi:hypothetical protein LguiA_028587 [Lonicera macranthoides]
MASEAQNNASQPQLNRDQLMNEAQSHAYNEHLKEVSGQQGGNNSYLEQSGEQVKTMAHGAADIATGAARGAVYMTQGAAAAAANLAQGAANAVNNTFATNKQPPPPHNSSP